MAPAWRRSRSRRELTPRRRPATASAPSAAAAGRAERCADSRSERICAPWRGLDFVHGGSPVNRGGPPLPSRPAGPSRIVICGAGAIGASVAWVLAGRGAPPVVDPARPAAAASGRASGFLASDWSAGTPLDALSRASFDLHREIAAELGAERLGYRPMQALMTAAADEEDLERYRRLPNPDWLDGNVVAHEDIGGAATTAQVNPLRFTSALIETAVERGAELRTGVVDGLAFNGRTVRSAQSLWTATCALPTSSCSPSGPGPARRSAGSPCPRCSAPAAPASCWAPRRPPRPRSASSSGATGRAHHRDRTRAPASLVYVAGHPEHGTLPDDPGEIVPDRRGLRGAPPGGGRCARPCRDAEIVSRIGLLPAADRGRGPPDRPRPGAPGAFLATGHASWGILNARRHRPDDREMILDGGSTRSTRRRFALSACPPGASEARRGRSWCRHVGDCREPRPTPPR